jgi:TonB family protein
MKLNQANVAVLPSPLQRAEMRSILDGAWPPLKPLPVFRFEDDDHRATIDFDKLRGEWVCRLTAFPSNSVRELRGGLREILLALPNGEAELRAESTEQAEGELERDTNRRKQALLEWKDNFESGTLYFELRRYLSGSQRTEIDDSLRLSLTARQLQCSAKNVAYVFDALSGAGGRPATLIQLARRKKAELEAGTEVLFPEEKDRDNAGGQVVQFSLAKMEPAIVDLSICKEETAEPCDDLESFPAISIASVPSAEEKQPSLELVAKAKSPAFEVETSEMLIGDLQEDVIEPSTFIDLEEPLRASKAEKAPEPEEPPRSRFPVLEISGLQVAAIALVFLLAVAGVAGGLSALHGQFEKYFGRTNNSTPSAKVVLPAVPDRADEMARSNSVSPVVAESEKEKSHAENVDQDLSPAERAASEPSQAKPEPVPLPPAKKLRGRIPFEIISNESDHDPEPAPEVISRDSLSPLETSSGRASNSNVPNTIHSPEHSSKAIASLNGQTKNEPPRKASKAPHGTRASTILVTIPAHGSKPFRVIFPEKAIAASSSFAMSSQLSVLVPPEAGAAAAHKPARLQAGELVSYVWPHFPRPKDSYGASETVRVRTTIGPSGQILDVKLLEGSSSFLPATIRAIHQWRYTPTRLNDQPVKAQQDVTIEFRPSEYSSKVPTRHSSLN